MIPLLEVCRRAQNAPAQGMEEFELDNVFGTLRRLEAKYGLAYDPDTPVPSDDALADKVFDAAVEFFVECGVFFNDTSSVIRFTKGEVLEAVERYNGDCRFGEGKEARVFRARKPDSASRPWCHVGSGIVASTEEIAFQIVRGNASIAQADSMSVCALDRIDGRKITTGQPTEILGAIRSLRIARDACEHAGRPGLPIINGIATAGSAISTLAAAAPQFVLRPSDCIIVGSLAEMKTNREMLAKVAWCLESGYNIVLASAPMLGGFAAGAVGTAILNAAYALFGMLVYQCNYYLTLPVYINTSCSSHRDVIWATAVSCQAVARNTNLPTLALGYIAGGPMTRSFYYESAAFVAASIASGVSTQTPHPAKATLADYVTPMEMATTNDIALACAGMSRKQANAVVLRLLPGYEAGIATASIGHSYTECFHLATGRPTDEHADFVAGIREELNRAGIPV